MVVGGLLASLAFVISGFVQLQINVSHMWKQKNLLTSKEHKFRRH